VKPPPIVLASVLLAHDTHFYEALEYSVTLSVISDYAEVGGPSSGLIGQIADGIQGVLDWIDP